MSATVVLSEERGTTATYRRRIRAWMLYDWASSAFVTTIVSAVLPFYYSQVAGATLPSASIATQYWSLTLSVSIFIVALLSPILGTVSDLIRGKKRFLSIFVGLGVVGSGLLTLVDSGDWLLASLVFILGRVGFGGANVFYDSLLPHVAREEDRDRVSAQGYAIGYLGGGLLLAANVYMIQTLPDNWGVRLSMLSVGLWWALFSIPLFRSVPEPPAATAALAAGESLLRASFGRIWQTLGHVRQYRQLFRFLVAYLIYNDGIGVIISMAAIYVAELGFGLTESLLALLLIQFVGIPYSLIFGSLPRGKGRRKAMLLAFVSLNIVALPAVGLAGRFLLPQEMVGRPSPAFAATATAVGQGTYPVGDEAVELVGPWQVVPVDLATAGAPASNRVAELFQRVAALLTGAGEEVVPYARTGAKAARLDFAFNGQVAKMIYSTGPDHGQWVVLLDGEPLLEDGEPVVVDARNPTPRYGVTRALRAPDEGEHRLTLVNQGGEMGIAGIEVLAPLRTSSLGAVLALVLGTQVLLFLLAALLGPALFGRFTAHVDARRSIMLALIAYAVIAVWGFFLNSVIEFWFMAWMVAVVQGGSQALSRSLYADMTPVVMSGEFFGLFSIMSKFASFLSPLVFFVAIAWFGNSRPAILSIVIFFIVGIVLLARVDVDEGRRAAEATDAAILAD